MATVEYVLTYDVTSAGEVEDIEQRLRATSPTTMDVVESDDTVTEFLTLLGGTDPNGRPVIDDGTWDHEAA